MKLKVKNFLSLISMVFTFGMAMLTLFLPYIFFKGTELIARRDYGWFIYFNLVFLFTIMFMMRKCYFELIRAEIKGSYLHFYNFLIIPRKIELTKIKGYKTGIDDNQNKFVSLYNLQNRKLLLLKDNYYSNLPEFIEDLNIKYLDIEYTSFQKVIIKISGRNRKKL
jgi:hypothetical protein